jgi:hypothetical protein
MTTTDEMRKAKRARLVALFGADTGNGIADIHERRALEDAIGVFPDIVVVESVEPPDGYAGPDFSMALDEEGNIDVDAALDILRAASERPVRDPLKINPPVEETGGPMMLTTM